MQTASSPGELFSMIPDCWWVWGWQERANSIGFPHPILLMSPIGAPAVNHTGSPPNLYLREEADEQRCWAAGLARSGWLKINNIAEDPVPPLTERMKILGQLGSLNNQTIFFPLNFQGLGTSLVAQWLKLCFQCKRHWVWSLVGELRSHAPYGEAKKFKKKFFFNVQENIDCFPLPCSCWVPGFWGRE